MVCRGKKIAMDIARGIDKMHSRRLVHLDLKSPNVLLSASGTAKIAVRARPAHAPRKTRNAVVLAVSVGYSSELPAQQSCLDQECFGSNALQSTLSAALLVVAALQGVKHDTLSSPPC